MPSVRKLKIIIFITIFFIINVNSSFASNNLKFKNITIEQGLSQGTIEDMYQDEKGYVWIATQDGLNRYNGYEFKQYRHNIKDKTSIISNNIIKVTQDNNHNIWVGTSDGISKMVIDEKFINYTSDKDKGNLSDSNICDILITSKGKIIVATINGLNIYDEKEDKFKRIFENELTNQFIYTLEEDKNGNIWVGTKDGLNKVNLENKSVKKIYDVTNKDSKEEYDVYSLCSYNDELLIGSMSGGLSKMDLNTNKVTSLKYDKHNKSINFVKDILVDQNGVIWICTDDGLLEYDKEKFNLYRNKPYDSHSLISNNTISIMQDKSGLIWVGTYTGISLFDPQNRITHYENNPYDKNSLSSSVIHGIYEDNDGLLWIGTKSDGVNIVNRKNDVVKTIKKDDITDNRIRDIKGDGNKVWIATNSGLNEINKDNYTIKKYTTENGLLDNYVRTIFLDGNYVFIATYKGVNVLDTKTGKIGNINGLLEKNGLNKKYISFIYKDKDGVYWIGSSIDGGMISYNSKTKKSKLYNQSDGLTTDEVRGVVEDNNKNLWIATNYGISKLDKKTGNIISYTEKDGLANNTVYGVILDEDGNPWMSTNNGICMFNKAKKKFINFNVTDGLQGNEFNGNAYLKNKKGELLFGGVNGVNIINPKDLLRCTDVPKVRIDEFLVNGKSITSKDDLIFDSDENTIEIKYFLPDYKNTQKTQYMYKLEGSNDKWKTTKDNNVTYSNLQPGKYIFKVRAINNNADISNEAIVKFQIRPPWWLSNQAIFLYCIIVVGLIFNNQIKMRKLDKLVEIRTKELKYQMKKNKSLYEKVIELERRKNNYFVNLSHELRTPLNLISGTEQLLTNLNRQGKVISSSKLQYHMDVIKRNTNRLLKLINNIIDTSKMENGNYILNIGEHDIVYLVEEAALSLIELANSKGINIIVDPHIEEKIILCDEHDIERCIVNLVNNAIKFTGVGGKIEVIIEEVDDDNIKIEIIDNGIGIDSDYHKSIFSRFTQVIDPHAEAKQGSGLGLTITKQIINLHKGKIYVESEVGKGTKFTIILPENMNKIIEKDKELEDDNPTNIG